MTKKKEPGCTGCSFRGQKRLLPQIVADSPSGVRTLFIGESPTWEDVQAGRLGEEDLFKEMIERHNVKRYAFTNVVLCNPPRDKKAKVADLENCSIFLDTFLWEFDPDQVVCLGKLAARAVLGKEIAAQKMYKLREQSPITIGEGESAIKYFVTYSPKAVYKRPKLIDDFVADFDFIFDPPEPTWIDPTITWLSTYEKADNWLTSSFQSHNDGLDLFMQPVALDFETTGLHPIADRPVTIALSWDDNRAAVFNLHDLTDKQMAEILTRINRFLKLSACVVYHNAKFDMKFFKQWSGVKPPLGWDTKLADYALTGNPEASRGLKYLARRKLFAPVYNEDIVFDGTTPLEDMAIYNGQDSSTTLQLYELQKAGEDIWHSADLMEHLYETTDMLMEAELHGAPVKEEWLADRKTVLEKEVSKLQAEFDAIDLNPNSYKQIREYFNISESDKEALKAVRDPLAKKILDFRASAKELSTYVTGFSEHIVNGRVHTDYLVPGTLTGRLASRGPNMQNLKASEEKDHDYQAVVETSDPNKRVVHFDYSQVEMRILATESMDEHLLDVFRSGRSIHKELAIEVFGPDYTDRQYTDTKSANFGVIYGISPFGLSHLIKSTEEEAAVFLNAWYAMYPDVSIWQNKVKDTIREQGYVETRFGRRRRFDLERLVVKQSTIFREGINFKIQSPACDIYLKAALAIWKDIGIYPIQLVHDELVYELDITDIDDTMDYISWKMQKVGEDLTDNKIPIPAEVKGEE
jgi:DNA polymerase-1